MDKAQRPQPYYGNNGYQYYGGQGAYPQPYYGGGRPHRGHYDGDD